MKKMMIEASLVPCLTDIEAKAGDQLMIFDGKVIGVYTGRAEAPVKDMAKVMAGRAGGTMKRVSKESYSDQEKRRLADMEKVLDVLRKEPDLILNQIATRLGIKRGTKEYGRVSYILRVLRENGKVKSETEGDYNQSTKYRIAA